MNQVVTEFIQKNNQTWQIELCTSIRETIHESVPDVTEWIQYGKPHFLKEGTKLDQGLLRSLLQQAAAS